MKTYSSNAAAVLSDLRHALSQDPLSFSGWELTLLPAGLHEDWGDAQPFYSALEEALGDSDSCLFLLNNGDALVLAGPEREQDLLTLVTKAYSKAYGQSVLPAKLVSYDLCHQCQVAEDMIASQLASCSQPEIISLMQETEPQRLPIDVSDLEPSFTRALAERNARSPLRVMIVEDDIMTRKLVSSQLKAEHVIITAVNASEALRNYMIYAPDIVFLDINLPMFSGLDILPRIRNIDPQANVVMFSGNATLDNICLALNRGARGFLPKPFRKDRLMHYMVNLGEPTVGGRSYLS